MNSDYKYNGLIYQSLVSSVMPEEYKKETPISEDLGPVYQSPSFVVEPVKEWVQPDNFDWNGVIEERPDNYVIDWDKAPGKVYKSSEKEEFKSDLYNAYMKVLTNRGVDEDTAGEYAKRLVSQDALESRYGQSSLSRFYNFGGIKDFRQASDSVKVATKEHDGAGYKTVRQPFRKFKNLDEYANYKIDLLSNSNYNVFSYRPEMMYRRLVTAPKKYATDPKYEQKLNAIHKRLWGR